MNAPAETTAILLEAAAGDDEAARRLQQVIYDELRRLAGRSMANERPDHTLQPTALAHEAYLRLVDQKTTGWRNRAHFLAIASELIRRILVDHARTKGRLKRGGGMRRVDLADPASDVASNGVDLLALDEALDALGDRNERHRRVVELRFFGGLTVDECAVVLDVSAATVKADWSFARAWLRRALDE